MSKKENIKTFLFIGVIIHILGELLMLFAGDYHFAVTAGLVFVNLGNPLLAFLVEKWVEVRRKESDYMKYILIFVIGFVVLWFGWGWLSGFVAPRIKTLVDGLASLGCCVLIAILFGCCNHVGDEIGSEM